MPEVTVRDAQADDASAIGVVSAAAIPQSVRSSARVAADMADDARLGRRRWVAVLGDHVVGTGTAQQVIDRWGEREVFLTVAVHPDRGSQGVGTRLLVTAAAPFPGATRLQSVGNGDPISLSFAVRNGFLPESERSLVQVDPRSVPAAAVPPAGLREVTLEALPDLRMLLATHNVSVGDDQRRRSRRLTMYQLRADWWDRPDNAPELSWGLLADGASGPVLAAFTSVQVDRERGRAWSWTTATHPSFRGQGLARWVKQRTLGSLADAGVREAWAPVHPTDAAMLAVNAALGYQAAATSVRLGRRMPR